MVADTNKSAFADLVYTVLVAEKKWPLKKVAEAMGMLYATLHARLHQRVAFNPEEIRALIVAAPDIRFAAYFLEGTPFIAIDGGAEPTDDSPLSVHLGATRTVLEAADVLRAVEKKPRRQPYRPPGQGPHRQGNHRSRAGAGDPAPPAGGRLKGDCLRPLRQPSFRLPFKTPPAAAPQSLAGNELSGFNWLRRPNKSPCFQQ